MAENTDSPVQVNVSEGVGAGQAQVAGPKLSDGRHAVHEARIHTDRVILDASSPLAVQVPEGVGASTYGHRSPMGEAMEAGTPEEQFTKAAEEDAKKSKTTKS